MTSLKQKVGAAALGAALVFGGAAGASALTGSAGAQDTTAVSTTVADTIAPATSASSTDDARDNDSDREHGPHTANGITESVLTGTDAEKVAAAALAAVPGGTVERVETDAEGAAYEAHVTKPDGSRVTVKLDAGFAVTGTAAGRG